MENQAGMEPLVEQVKVLQDAAAQLVRVLPGLVRGSSRLMVKQALMSHLRHTQQQWARLEQVIGKLGAGRKRSECDAVTGILRESAALLVRECQDTAVDAVILIAVRRVTQFEAASYRSLLHAEVGNACDGVTHLLELSLEETEAAESRMAALLRSIVGRSQADANYGKGEPDASARGIAVDIVPRSHGPEAGRGSAGVAGAAGHHQRTRSDGSREPRPVQGGQVTAA
jgi:ferritin-like metal-binding protein YciE